MSFGEDLHSRNQPPTGLHESLHDFVIQNDMVKQGYLANRDVCAEFALSMGGAIYPFVVSKLREDPTLYRNLLDRLKELNLDAECTYDSCSSGSLLYSVGPGFVLRLSGELYQEPTIDPLPLPLLKPAYQEIVSGEKGQISLRVSPRVMSFDGEPNGLECKKRMFAVDTMRGLGYVQPGHGIVKIGYFGADEDMIPFITTLGPWKDRAGSNIPWQQNMIELELNRTRARIEAWEGRQEFYCKEMKIPDPLTRLEAVTSEARLSRNNNELL